MKNHRMQKYLKKSLALFFAVTVAASTLSAPAFAEEQQSEISNIVVEENQVQESEGAKTSVDKPDNQSDNEAADTNEKAEGRKTEPVTQSAGNGSKAVQTYSENEAGTSAENAIVVPDDAYIFTGGAIKGISNTWFNTISPNGDVRYLKLVIPAEINGQAVTNISSYALQYKGNGFQPGNAADLGKIKIVNVDFSKASNLEIIKDFAFDQRSEISGTVDLSNTKVTTIGAGAFRETAITNVVLPDKLEALGDVKTNAGSFASCANLESVKYASYKGDRPVAFPDTLVTIGKQCFRYSFSKNMSFAVDIPESVKNIGSEAFNTNNNNGSSRVSTIYVKRTADYSGYDKYAFQNGKSFIVFPSAKAYQEAKNRVSNSKTYTPTYEVQAVFKKSEDNTVVDTQKKLYNQYICYEKNGDDVWRISEDYALPGLEGVALKLGYEIGWYFEKNKESVNSESTVNDESTLPDTINILTDGITISEPKVTVSGADGVCEGSDITLKAEITNKIEGFHYEYVWAKYDKQTNKWIEIEGADKDTFQITEGGKYYLAAVTAYDDEGRESEQGGDYTWVSKRQHHWKYESKDNQITVKCINSGCKYEAEGITSILNAENMEYTGKVYDKASFGTEVADLTGVTADEIQYYEENSDTPLDNAPVNAGKYKAGIKLSNGESAVAAFEITKAKIMPEVTVENWTYGDEENEPVVTGNDGNAEVTYTYYTDEACTQKTTESSGAENEGEMPTQPGKYYVKAIVAETDNYQPGEAVTSFTIRKIDAPKFDEIKENEDGEYEIGQGTLSIQVKKEGKVPETILITSKAEILQMLVDNGDITQDDLSLISKGGSVDVVLVVKDATDTVTEEAKNAMTNVATKSGYTIGQYIDISLYKIVNGMTEDAEQIHNTTGKVKIAVQIPENLINKDNSKKREYAMIRNHEGTAEILDGTYDANAKTFTFETDKFSDYAIAYKDTVKSSGAGTKINPAAKPAKGQPKATKDQKKSGNAKTGDTNNLVLWTLTAVLAVLVATLIMELRRRKRY